MKADLPSRQSELVRQARGTKTRTQFAKELGVDRTGIWRYENEKMGVPLRVLNHCLGLVAEGIPSAPASPVRAAQEHIRLAAEALRAAEGSPRPAKRDTKRVRVTRRHP